MKKGFATSAILYTILLLFIVLLVGILNNLQNKKVILDALKEDTINALQNDTVMNTLLEQIANLNNKMMEIQNQMETMDQKIVDIEGKLYQFHPFTLNKTVTTTTSLSYTGLASPSLPKNSYFCVTAQARYGYSIPSKLILSNSSTNAHNNAILAAAPTDGTHMGVTYCGAGSNPIYVWAQYRESAINDIHITGFYITNEND